MKRLKQPQSISIRVRRVAAVVVLAVLANLIVGVLVGSPDASSQGQVVSCNAMQAFWSNARNVFIDDEARTIRFTWTPGNGNGNNGNGNNGNGNNGNGNNGNGNNGNGGDRTITISMDERGCNQDRLAPFLDQVVAHSAHIETVDCLFLLATLERLEEAPPSAFKDGKVLIAAETSIEVPVRLVDEAAVRAEADVCTAAGYSLPDQG